MASASWSNAALTASLVAVASFVYSVGPRSPLAIGSILLWSLSAALAAVFGFLPADGCLACCPSSSSPGEKAPSAGAAGSQNVLKTLGALTTQDRIVRELSLEDLNIDDANVIASAVAEFGSLVGLERIGITDSPQLSDTEWQGILTRSLAGSTVRLLELDLSGNIGIVDSVIETLVKLLDREGPGHSLSVLRLPHCSLTAASVAYIAGWTSSSRPQGNTVPPLDAPQVRSSPPPLAGPLANPQQAQGPLTAPSVDLSTLLELVEGSQLRFLSLAGNNLSGCGRSIARILRLPSLAELDLADCQLSRDDVERIGSALPRSNLSRLELAGNDLGREGALALARGLAACKLDSLGLERNAIPGDGVLDALTRSYEQRPFSSLRLEENQLSKAEMSSLAQKLQAARSKAGFVMTACPLGCECNGRGDVM